MIYLRAKGGEELKDFITRAITLAAQASDSVEARYQSVTLTIHPNFVDTVVQWFNEKRASRIEASRGQAAKE